MPTRSSPGSRPIRSSPPDGAWYYFEAVHPWLLPDGGLIIKDHYSPLFRIDRCSTPVWTDESLIFHHSTEADADGNLWIPTHVRPRKPIYPSRFSEDGLTQITPDGEILQTLSLPDIFAANGRFAQMFGAGAYDDDPLHLNDIQPVLSDGPYWKKGDLFLSMRRISTVLLFRPSTGRIVWLKQGPWLGQHDVDILDDHRIAVFDNRAFQRGLGPLIDEASETVIYDFASELGCRAPSPGLPPRTDRNPQRGPAGFHRGRQSGRRRGELRPAGRSGARRHAAGRVREPRRERRDLHDELEPCHQPRSGRQGTRRHRRRAGLQRVIDGVAWRNGCQIGP